MSRVPRFDYVLVTGIFNKMNNTVLQYLNHGVALCKKTLVIGIFDNGFLSLDSPIKSITERVEQVKEYMEIVNRNKATEIIVLFDDEESFDIIYDERLNAVLTIDGNDGFKINKRRVKNGFNKLVVLEI